MSTNTRRPSGVLLRNPGSGRLEALAGWTNTGRPVFHGSQGGFSLHVIRAEVPCGPCREASAEQAARFFGGRQ
jgi:hypothetical protein